MIFCIMTKQQEIARINSLIATLGPASYLGPWLNSVRLEVEKCIADDVFPDISLADIAAKIRKDKEECTNACQLMVAKATRECEDKVKAARETAAYVRSAAKVALQSAISNLDGMWDVRLNPK